MEALKGLLTEQNVAFEAFKKANDERIKDLEGKGHADPLLEGKVDKANEDVSSIQAKLEELEKKMNRPGAGGDPNEDQDAKEYEDAFSRFIKRGDISGVEELHTKRCKDLNITTPSDGGYAVPDKLDRTILDLMVNESPMRSICSVIKIGGENYKKLVNLHGTASGWVDEDDARPKTDGPSLAQITPFMGEVYANPAATQTMLDDSFFNAEAWLASEVAAEFAEEEGTAFLSGNGTKKPKGILAYTLAETADATRTFGQLEKLTAASATAITTDEILEVIYSLNSKMRKNAKFMMNSTTTLLLRKLKIAATGAYAWQPSIQAGQPASLFGYSVVDNEEMDAPTAALAPIIFGDFRRGYTIVDRMGIRSLRDPYTNKPYVQFYSTKRVGGMVTDSNALKVIVMKSS